MYSMYNIVIWKLIYLQVARLKRLYESWEENSDLGFVLMKVSHLSSNIFYDLFGFIFRDAFVNEKGRYSLTVE